MVTVYGLNDEIGNLTYYDSSSQNEYGFTKPYSEETARKIDAEISQIIEKQYLRAIDVLEKNKDKLIELAERLLEKEVIFKEDLEKIFGQRPFEKTFDGKGQEVTKEEVIVEEEPPMNKEEEKENK
ncbi:MAG: peptidase M41, partial [Maribacter sp.]|nr:peptidase M41 [Maribacter sp.]